MLRPIPALFAALALAASTLSAGEARTLTSKDGRAIDVEIIGYKGETLRVRRADLVVRRGFRSHALLWLRSGCDPLASRRARRRRPIR